MRSLAPLIAMDVRLEGFIIPPTYEGYRQELTAKIKP